MQFQIKKLYYLDVHVLSKVSSLVLFRRYNSLKNLTLKALSFVSRSQKSKLKILAETLQTTCMKIQYFVNRNYNKCKFKHVTKLNFFYFSIIIDTFHNCTYICYIYKLMKCVLLHALNLYMHVPFK